MKHRFLTALAVAGLAGPLAGQSSPASVFDAYVKAVAAGDIHAVDAIVAPEASMVQGTMCAPPRTPRMCLMDYLNMTVVSRHATITPIAVKVEGDTVVAKLELRSDVTRAAGITRLAGTDRITTVHGKIISFDFRADESDPATPKFFAFLRHAGPPGMPPPPPPAHPG